MIKVVIEIDQSEEKSLKDALLKLLLAECDWPEQHLKNLVDGEDSPEDTAYQLLSDYYWKRKQKELQQEREIEELRVKRFHEGFISTPCSG